MTALVQKRAARVKPTNRRFYAVWYDPEKVETNARKAGWPGEDSMLDYYHPDEHDECEDQKAFPTLDEAVAHLTAKIKAGLDFWGDAEIREVETSPERCRYCTCGGKKLVAFHRVNEDGLYQSESHDECLD
jgi:hypothetical protein